MQLFGDRVLVEPIPHPETSPSGIALPDSARPRYFRSTVVQIGQGNPDLPTLPPIKPGDVVYHFAQGPEFDVDGRKLKLLSEGDLIGKE